MTAVSEWIVREYFESLGYLVSQPCKHEVPGRQKTPDEEIDLLAHNPRIKDHKVPPEPVWTSRELRTVSRAVVAVRGWHTERFYASTLSQAPDIFRLVEPATLRVAARRLGSAATAKVLCIPRLPASDELKKKLIKGVRDGGIDAVITFRTMLGELIAAVDTQKNYEKSDLLQIIRLLKIYDFLKDDQLELFVRKRRRKRKKPTAGTEDGAG